MIHPISIPSSTTPTLLLARRDRPDNHIAIQNHGTASFFVSYDGTENVTVSGGLRPGIEVAPGQTLFLGVGPQDAMAMSNPIYGVQTSGSTQIGTILRT